MTNTIDRAELLGRIEALLPEIPGWCTMAKASRLVEAVLATRPLVSVEIGVFGGSSLLPQAMALEALAVEARSRMTDPPTRASTPVGVLYGIDPWQNDAALEAMQDDANRAWWSNVSLDAIRESCQGFVDRLGLRDRCRLIRARSEDVVQFWDDASIDVLHVDGNHSEEKSSRDVELYLPKVRRGGVMFFDDVSWTEGGKRTTNKALTLLEEGCERLEGVGDCAVFRKR